MSDHALFTGKHHKLFPAVFFKWFHIRYNGEAWMVGTKKATSML